MNKLIILIAVTTLFSLPACGPGEAEKAAEMQRTSDSISRAHEAQAEAQKLLNSFDSAQANLKTNPDAGANETIDIGNQTWTRQNLNVSTFRNGDTIPQVWTDEQWKEFGTLQQPAWCYYNNDRPGAERSGYGKLYNWWAVIDKRGLAPEGFHIPNRAEWEIFLHYLGHDRYDQFSTVAGEKLISESGFNAKRGGIRFGHGSFSDIAENNGLWLAAHWWTSEPGNCSNPPCENYHALYVNMKSDYSITGPANSPYNQNYGMSVRCIKGQLDSLKVAEQAAAELAADSKLAGDQYERDQARKAEEIKKQPKKTYLSDGQKCSQCFGHYQDGFCTQCRAASPERKNESYSKAANCEFCGGAGYVSAGGIHDRKKICPSCKGKRKQIY